MTEASDSAFLFSVMSADLPETAFVEVSWLAAVVLVTVEEGTTLAVLLFMSLYECFM